MSEKQNQANTEAESRKLTVSPPQWPRSAKPPETDNPGVRIIFQGLLVFCHKGKQCEIALFRNDSKHHLEVTIFENCKQVFATTDDVDPIVIRTMSIGIDGEAANVSFFHVGDPGTFDRVNGHQNDFWWLLDLDDAYGKKLDKQMTAFKTKLTVSNGLFYTFQHTNSQFIGVDGPFPHGGKSLGHMAKIMAADIPFEKDKSVTLKINGKDVFHPLKFKPGTRYEIYVSNECFDASGVTCADSDFDQNFEVTKLAHAERFQLKLDGAPGSDDPPRHLCISKDYHVDNTDAAPCVGVGFGQGDGFP
ncbi:MAG TPA: hypothetical protein VIW64_15090 [Pyrinomonadaceae bacterium]|jgi:hypothetical protein